MYHKILIALSLEHGIAERALEAARCLAAEGARIEAVHVYEAPRGAVSAYLDQKDVQRAFNSTKERLAERVAQAEGVEAVMLTGHSSRTLTEYAESSGADLIITGSHKPGVSDYFLGTTAARIVRHAPCTVVVLR